MTSETGRTPREGRISGLLFDLDGTLIATRRLYLEAFADALEPLLGHRPTHEEMMAKHPRAEVRFLKQLTADAVPGDSGRGRTEGLREAEEAVLSRFFEAYRARHPTDFEGIYPGVPAMLDGARATGLPMGLVTGKSRRSWDITGPAIDLGAFHVEVFDDDVTESKPDPAGLRIALDALGSRAAETLYIGDSVTDLEAAVSAGVQPVAVLWSKRAHERSPFRDEAIRRGGRVLATPEDLAGLLAGG